LDDTLADTTHRQHILDEGDKEDSATWNAFFDACDGDTPKREIIGVLNSLALASSLNYRIEIWTGRSDRVFEKTEAWLEKHVESYCFCGLRMRQEGDYRHDTEIKGEWIEKYGKPDLIFDDRNSTVKWFRERDITVCQVKESDF